MNTEIPEPARQTAADLANAVTDAQLHILRHSLGLNYGARMYRNHFVTGEGSTDYPDCRALVDAGYMTRQKGGTLTGGDDVFYVTDAGKELAKRGLELGAAK